jgi:hypothetical protein
LAGVGEENNTLFMFSGWFQGQQPDHTSGTLTDMSMLFAGESCGIIPFNESSLNPQHGAQLQVTYNFLAITNVVDKQNVTDKPMSHENTPSQLNLHQFHQNN